MGLRLEELAARLKAFCTLKVKTPTDIDKIEADIKQKESERSKQLSQRYEQAYQSYNYAVDKAGEPLTDKEAHDQLKDNRLDEYDLPEFETWQRYVRKGRNYYGTQKNTPRAGRSHGRSIVYQNQIEDHAEVTSNYTTEAD